MAEPAPAGSYGQLPPICTQLLDAKARKDLTFGEIAQKLERDEVWVAAALYGQARLDATEINKLAEVLDISSDEITVQVGEHWWPNRGLGPVPPMDPLIYRLYEGILLYGHPIKAVIHEKFGDGIMSMIDCKVHIERKADPKGDRVLLTFDGKFMPHIKW